MSVRYGAPNQWWSIQSGTAADDGGWDKLLLGGHEEIRGFLAVIINRDRIPSANLGQLHFVVEISQPISKFNPVFLGGEVFIRKIIIKD